MSKVRPLLRNGSRLLAALAAPLAVAPLQAQAQAQAPPRAPVPQDRASAEQELRDLQAMKGDMQQRMGDFDARIHALEARLGGPVSPDRPMPPVQVTPALGTNAQTAQATPAAAPTSGGFKGVMERSEQIGRFDRDVGWVLVDTPDARLNLGLMTYARYLNQNDVDPTYVDSLGREIAIDKRNEVQLYKVSLQFKGWLFDPRFQYLIFAWTNNANQGEGGQTVIAGFLRYKFAKWLAVSAGIMPLPTTRSTNYSFPKWLRHDNRVMADEFYRGSYTSGIDVLGEITKGLNYRVMIGNNLSTLGVSSKQLDNKFDTVAGTIYWMPTTGEYGLAEGFGDYDYHQKIATYIGLNAGRSTETAQGQPSQDSFENSQIRMTDGTLLFSPDPFGTGGKVEQALWKMASIDIGAKYKGFSLEGQWFWRKVDHFHTLGFVPIDHLSDNGFALQASAMPIKNLLQVYATASKIWGQNGNPTEFAAGVNVYPFKRREMHVNLEAIKTDRSPVGGYHMPIGVGDKGWVVLSDWILMF